MKMRQLIPAVVLLTLSITVSTSQSAQDVSADAQNSQRLRRQVALSILRTINTAEVVDRSKYGTYSSWQTLLAHYPEYFIQLMPNTAFAGEPEILPGWNLRMNIHAGGQGYDILLRDMTDERCAYAAVTNENAIIWQGKAIDCKI